MTTVYLKGGNKFNINSHNAILFFFFSTCHVRRHCSILHNCKLVFFILQLHHTLIAFWKLFYYTVWLCNITEKNDTSWDAKWVAHLVSWNTPCLHLLYINMQLGCSNCIAILWNILAWLQSFLLSELCIVLKPPHLSYITLHSCKLPYLS